MSKDFGTFGWSRSEFWEGKLDADDIDFICSHYRGVGTPSSRAMMLFCETLKKHVTDTHGGFEPVTRVEFIGEFSPEGLPGGDRLTAILYRVGRHRNNGVAATKVWIDFPTKEQRAEKETPYVVRLQYAAWEYHTYDIELPEDG